MPPSQWHSLNERSIDRFVPDDVTQPVRQKIYQAVQIRIRINPKNLLNDFFGARMAGKPLVDNSNSLQCFFQVYVRSCLFGKHKR